MYLRFIIHLQSLKDKCVSAKLALHTRGLPYAAMAVLRNCLMETSKLDIVFEGDYLFSFSGDYYWVIVFIIIR